MARHANASKEYEYLISFNKLARSRTTTTLHNIFSISSSIFSTNQKNAADEQSIPSVVPSETAPPRCRGGCHWSCSPSLPPHGPVLTRSPAPGLPQQLVETAPPPQRADLFQRRTHTLEDASRLLKDPLLRPSTGEDFSVCESSPDLY